MSTTKLVAEIREKTGSAECRRMRRSGLVPGNLYGHGKDAVAISTNLDNVDALLKSGSRVIDVELNGQVEKALFKEVQWDALGSEIQHVDFMRIDAEQRVDVEAPVEIRGISPGVTAGGVLEQPARRLEINCLAVEVPDSIVVRISALKMGDTIYAKDVTLPDGAKLITPEESPIVLCAAPGSDGDEPEGDGDTGPVEPELIGRKAGDADGE